VGIAVTVSGDSQTRGIGRGFNSLSYVSGGMIILGRKTF